jgi:hypothetical protein
LGRYIVGMCGITTIKHVAQLLTDMHSHP